MEWKLFLNAFMFANDDKDASLAAMILEKMEEIVLVKKTTESATEFFLLSGQVVYIDPKGICASYPFAKREEALLLIKEKKVTLIL